MTTGTHPRGSSRPLLIAAVALAVLVVAGIAFHTLFVKAPAELAAELAGGVRELLNITPRVTIDQTVVIEANIPILEVAILSRDLLVEDRWQDQWLGSTKTVEIRGTFTAKAGFDLRQPFAIHIQRYPLTVRARLPEARVLSVEMKAYQILRDENGWWNRVRDEDREAAVERLQEAARREVEGSGILREVRTSAEERIREIVRRNGAGLDFGAVPGS